MIIPRIKVLCWIRRFEISLDSDVWISRGIRKEIGWIHGWWSG